MTQTLKVLAQNTPSANTLTTLYTVPGSTSTTVSSLVVCNTNNTSVTFRVSVAIAGAADTISQYIYYDLTLAANDTFIFTGGLSLATTDLIRIYASNTNVSFAAYGVEVS